jgi:outer membrane protein TolC
MQPLTRVIVLFVGILAVWAEFGWATDPMESRPVRIDLAEIGELDLFTAGRIALQDNPALSAGQERIMLAQQRMMEARAGYWPTLDAIAEIREETLSDNAYEERLRTAQLFDPNATVSDPEQYYEASLVINWALFKGFERKFANAAAYYGHEQSQAAYQDASRLLLSSVVNAYLRAQLALEDRAIAKADEDFNRRQLYDAETRFRTGTGALSDVYNFEIRVNSAITAGTVAQQAYEAAMIGLASLLGIPQGVFPSHIKLAALEPESPKELGTPDAEELVGYAQEHRPDIRQSDFSLKRAEAQVKTISARFYPTISLESALDGERIGDNNVTTDDFGSSIGINLTYNLFSGGADVARWNQAKARAREAEKTLENVKITVSSEIQTSLTELRSAQKQLALQRSIVSLVQKTRDLVEKEFAAGVTSLVRLNEAQRDLTTAQGRLALALAALHQAWYNVETNTGEILETFTPDEQP